VNWRYDWITDWDEIESPGFQEDWVRHWNASHTQNIFYHPAIAKAWISSKGGTVNFMPRFLRATTANGSVLLAPFVQKLASYKQAYTKEIFSLGYDLFDYCDPVANLSDLDSSVAYGQFFLGLNDHMAQSNGPEYDRFCLPRYRATSLISECHATAAEVDMAPFRNLGGFDDYPSFFADGVRKKHRYDLRRSEKTLGNLGDVKFEVCAPHEREKALSLAARMLEARDAKYGKTVVTLDYLVALIDNSLRYGILHLSCLKIGRKEISWHFGFQDRNCVYWYLPSYDMEYSNYSPGKLHVAKCIEWCFENKVCKLDFMRGSDSYKDQWCDDLVKLCRCDVVNPAVTSSVRRSLARLTMRVKYVKNSLRKIW
jgi:hypothetical protein